jgi:hypothetical protein
MLARTIPALAAAHVFAVLFGCGGSSEPAPEYPPMDDPEPTTTTTVEAIRDEPTEPPAAPVQVVAGERTAIEGAAPTLRIRAPRNGQVIRRGDVMLNVQLRNWTLAPDPGNHVHVIVDNEPYIAVRDVSAPLNLTALVRDNLGHELAAGSHVVRVFPSRPTHESVKQGSPFAAVAFHVGQQTEGFEFDDDAPLLTYSRPKGCYLAGERVLLDFYLSNVESLSADGFRVSWSIDDVSGEITEWAPHWIENLQPGAHEIRLGLLGADGNAAPGALNQTTRTITVATSCQVTPTPTPAPPTPEDEEEETTE